MFKFTAIDKTKQLDKEFKKYIKSTFVMDNPHLSSQFFKQIDEVNLVKGPYISISEPFKTGKTIMNLINEGILNKEFVNMPNLKLDRPLYLHQQEAIEKSIKGKNLVISTGTGSGKTEGFLIPIVNKILEDRKNDIYDCGVQALLLYPMNALANDQRERLRDVLKNNPDITFGFYTGETEEKQRKALAKYREENNRDPLENEIISRENLRENPPNILFTNYSMLEYMLLRPFDDILFKSENTKHWHYIVLDEAHVYRGALGIEISLLLKRLLGRINSKPQFILTSATLAQGKRDFPDVVTFAKRLTSQEYDIESIVVGTREPVERPNNLIKIDKSRYSEYLEDEKYIKEDYLKLLNGSLIDVGNQLFELLRHDENFYLFKNIITGPMDLETIKKRLPEMWSDHEITSLVDVVAKVNSYEDNFLIDIKYHTFVKALDGAHVILKPETKLFLRNINKYNLNHEYDEPNEVKTFQLGLCKYCNSAYLMGTIVNNKFYKIDDEELYTHYDEKSYKDLDFLLIKDLVSDLDNIDETKVKYANLCNKCGHIYDIDNVNALKCSCGDDYIIETIITNKDTSKHKTNLSICLSCGSRNNRGVIESFYIGKDSASALIAQILYRAMGKKVTKKETHVGNPFSPVPKHTQPEEYIKQFIAFSDSRQQASYFATYFDSIQTRFLRKRIIINILEEKKCISADDLINDLEYLIETEKLFQQDDENNKRNAWITYLIELLDVDRKFSLSGLGLLSFIPDINFSNINEEVIKENFGDLGIETFKKIIYFIIEDMRTIPAINYSFAKIPYNILKEYLEYRNNNLTGLVLELTGSSKYEKALIPSTNAGNVYSNYLKKALDIDGKKAEKFLKLIWQYLCNSEIIKAENNVYKYNALNFKIYNRNEIDWYQCEKCKTLSYININDVCIKSKCDGKLIKINPDKVHKNNYYYSEYLSKEIENIRVEEHTAQLSKEKGREYQRDFKEGKINILSSSTTFEMGVDLGSLDTVYMRNVPPTPANYVQRAGRAGRRKDTASYVLTFSSNQSHDYNYYKNPIKMIEGKIKPPSFEVENIKIIDRHILSVAMSMFFQVYPEYFKKIETMVFENGKDRFKTFLEENKNTFVKFITENIQPNFSTRFEDWFDDLFNSAESNLNIMIAATEEKIEQINEYLSSGELQDEEIGRYTNMRRNILGESTLNVLSNYSVIPKYGFPVDTVTLVIPKENDLVLNRDLSIAISEYAPESEVIVDKKKYASRYINLPRGSRPVEYFYKICKSCKSLSMNINKNNPSLEECKNCGNELDNIPNKFIKPIYGFVSELDPIKDKIMKPKKTYRGDYHYVGSLSDEDTEIVIGEIIKARLVKENRLAVINENPFFTCENCGYTKLDYKNEYHNQIQCRHKLPNSVRDCSNETLVRKSLGHDFRTDVVLIDIDEETTEYNVGYSLLYAMLEGISIALEIERDDISGILENINNKMQIILFDTVPGGAGHVRRLLDDRVFFSVIEVALEKVSQECCDETSSCYNCLRNYRNESLHHYLIRGLAKFGLEKLKKDLEIAFSGVKYNIVNYLKKDLDWLDTNIKEIFKENEELLEHLILEDLDRPNYAFAVIDFSDHKISSLLLWEKRKIILVESEDEIIKEIKDWKIFSMKELSKLIKELE